MISTIGLIGVETPLDRGGWGGDFLSNIVGMEEQIYNMVPGRALQTTVNRPPNCVHLALIKVSSIYNQIWSCLILLAMVQALISNYKYPDWDRLWSAVFGLDTDRTRF